MGSKNQSSRFCLRHAGDYELKLTGGEVVEQVIRPTGLLDPMVEVVAARGQVAHLLEQVRERTQRGERTLVTALTKRLAEDLAGYMTEQNALPLVAQ